MKRGWPFWVGWSQYSQISDVDRLLWRREVVLSSKTNVKTKKDLHLWKIAILAKTWKIRALFAGFVFKTKKISLLSLQRYSLILAVRSKRFLLGFFSKDFDSSGDWTSPSLSFLRPSVPRYDDLNFLLERLFPLEILPGLPNTNKISKKLLQFCNSRYVFSAVLLSKQSKGSKS